MVSFAEAAVTGLIPTWSKSCRESPKILGVANSFAGGVFLAIALMHILPEAVGDWVEYNEDKGKTGEFFPLPELLIFIGYTLILMIDKVIFDTHALFEHDHEDGVTADPAASKMEQSIKRSFALQQSLIERGDMTQAEVRKSMLEQRAELQDEVKSYLNPHDRFANRMKASLN